MQQCAAVRVVLNETHGPISWLTHRSGTLAKSSAFAVLSILSLSCTFPGAHRHGISIRRNFSISLSTLEGAACIVAP